MTVPPVSVLATRGHHLSIVAGTSLISTYLICSYLTCSYLTCSYLTSHRARWVELRTFDRMDLRDLHSKMLPTPFVASFIGRARPGDLYAPDAKLRAAAWAHWAISSMGEMTGIGDRAYVALVLEGRFYDPKGHGPVIRPHLEIPARVLGRPDADFPDRLAQMGNGLSFAWWMVPEVTAAKRALFNTPAGSIAEFVAMLADHRPGLRTTLAELTSIAAGQWGTAERLLISSPDGLAGDATGDFATDEVVEYFPAAAAMQLEVIYDAKLRSVSRQAASRRVGVWQVRGVDSTSRPFALGVLTPRLTANSQFRDRHFAPERESAAAMLVRGLLLRRLVDRHLRSNVVHQVGEPEPTAPKGGPYLRAVASQIGAKIPQASTEAALHFLQTYPKPERAWAVLEEWATRTGCLLTVTSEGFQASHRNALRFLRRAEAPEREDIDVVLPLGWLNAKVVRVTFSHPPTGEPESTRQP